VNNDFGLANKADNPHLPVTLGAGKRICFGPIASFIRDVDGDLLDPAQDREQDKVWTLNDSVATE